MSLGHTGVVKEMWAENIQNRPPPQPPQFLTCIPHEPRGLNIPSLPPLSKTDLLAVYSLLHLIGPSDIEWFF